MSEDEQRPEVRDGVPWCSYDRCPVYDGKRCMVIGFRPSSICEPAVVEMTRLLREARGLLHEASDLDQGRKGAGEAANMLGSHWHEDNDKWTAEYVAATGLARGDRP